MIFRFTCILCTSIIMICSTSLCQDDTSQEPAGVKNSLAASIGINDFHQRDKYLSPYTFDGVNFASKLSFQVLSSESWHNVDAFFSYGALNSDIQPRFVREYVAALSYSYVYSMGTTMVAGRPLQFSAGGGISSLLLFTDFNTTDETNYTTYDQSWYWSHSLNIVLSGGYEFDADKNLSVRFTVPVAGLVSRPENERWMSSNNSEVRHNYFKAAAKGMMEYIWDSFVLYTDIDYRHSLSSDFSLFATYRFGVVSSNKPASLLSTGMFMNNFLVGIDWQI